MATKLDGNQVLKRSFDEANDRIRVDAEVTATLGTVEVVISDTNDSIKLGNGSGTYMGINSDGSTNNVTQNTIVPFKFDGIYPSYPNSTTEIYVYKQGLTTVATVTVVYVNASKDEIVSIVRT